MLTQIYLNSQKESFVRLLQAGQKTLSAMNGGYEMLRRILLKLG